MPFGDWLTYWYENHSKPKIRPTTQETYESRVRLHIIPEIGDIPLNKLTQNDLQQDVYKRQVLNFDRSYHESTNHIERQ